MPPMPAEAEAPPDLVTPLTARPALSARRATLFELRRPTARSGSSRSRSGMSRASCAGSARPANGSSGATRAMATARSASCGDVASDVVGGHHRLAATRRRRAGRHRRLRSARIPRPRRRAPRPTSDTERTATASAASAPARRAAATSRSARSVRADWSSREDILAFMLHGMEEGRSRGRRQGNAASAEGRNSATSRQA